MGSLCSFVCVLSLVAAAPALRSEPVPSAEPRSLAPEFNLRDLDGKTIKSSDLRGKVVVIEFWATWCGPCARTLAVAAEVGQEHRRDVTVLAINIDDGERGEKVRKYLSARKIPVRAAIGGSAVAKQFGVGAIPHTAVIDRDGRLVGTHVGISSEAAFREQLLRDIASAK